MAKANSSKVTKKSGDTKPEKKTQDNTINTPTKQEKKAKSTTDMPEYLL